MARKAIKTASPDTGQGLAGFPQGPVWHRTVPASAAAVASEAGTFVFDNRTLTVLDNTTGKTVTEQDLEGAVVLTQETELDGQPAMIWQIGSTLHAWGPGLAGKPAIKADLPEHAQLSAAGRNVLVQTPDGKAWTLTKSGLAPITVPAGRTALGIDDGKLLSGRFGGALTISSPDGTQQRDVPVKAPAENLRMTSWVTAGHGIVVIEWSAFPESKDPQNPVTTAIYRAETGELLSALETPKSRIDEDPAWVRGQGFQWASIGNFVYDLTNGQPIVDLKAQGITRSGILGDALIGEDQSGPLFLRQDTAWHYSSSATPLALTTGGITIRTNNDIQHFTAG